MNFPPVPTCHHQAGEPMYRGLDKPEWRQPNIERVPYCETYRSCWYCGSIHPEDLIRISKEAPLQFEMADWKYGFPHKIYVDNMPNPIAGKIVEVGSFTKDGVTTPEMGAAPEFQRAKFYTRHFFDKGYDDEALLALNGAIRSVGYSFRTDGDKLFWIPV